MLQGSVSLQACNSPTPCDPMCIPGFLSVPHLGSGVFLSLEHPFHPST